YIEHDFSDIDLDIPDGDTRGLTEMFRIDQRGSITYMQLELQIEHTWIGDLTVTLISPSGTETVLHDRTGSSRDHIDRTYDIPDVVGERAAGIWRLRVVDYATRDFGILK